MKDNSFSIVSNKASIGHNVQIWSFAQIRENAKVGDGSIIGSHAYIDSNVHVGQHCKIQNGALIYDPAVIGDYVFVGPGAVLTNDRFPRATKSDGSLKKITDWEKVGVEVLLGASIGAGAICVAPVSIGKWSLIAAGSVVTSNVRNFALVAGNPARQIGWVGPAGKRLVSLTNNSYICPESNLRFIEMDNELLEVESL